MSDTIVHVAYLVAALCFIVALKGLSTPRYARTGNLVGAAGMAIAVAAVLAMLTAGGWLAEQPGPGR